MRIWKRIVQFYMGGAIYMTLEFLWRGRSSGSMFLLGGTCFLLLGKLRSLRLPLLGKILFGAGAITVLELLTGLLVNRSFSVWDYRRMPLNFMGQICLPYTLLWMPLSLIGMFLHEFTERWIDISLSSSKIKEKD